MSKTELENLMHSFVVLTLVPIEKGLHYFSPFEKYTLKTWRNFHDNRIAFSGSLLIPPLSSFGRKPECDAVKVPRLRHLNAH
jgi:hypothetical protein